MAHKSVEIGEDDDFITQYSAVKEGGTVFLSGDHVCDRDIVIRTGVCIIGKCDASLIFRGGSRLLWCNIGKISNVNMRRELDKEETSPKFPNAILAVRGLGRLMMKNCVLEYTQSVSKFSACGVHVDFGAILEMDVVKILETPGPCVKIMNARADIKLSVLFMKVPTPTIIVTRGCVNVVKCIAVHVPRMPEVIWLYYGATANISADSDVAWRVRRI